MRYLVHYARKQLRQLSYFIKERRPLTLHRALARPLADRRPPFPTEFFKDALITATDDEAMIHAAHLLTENKFGFFGSEPIPLGNEIDWHYDFINKAPLSRAHVSKLFSGYTGDGKDVKVAWELSRFQFLPTLWRAYDLTHNEFFAKKAADLILDWIEKNPIYYGVNWRCPMDLGIQVCNWLLAMYLFEDSRVFRATGFREKLFLSMAAHGEYIYEQLEYGPGWNSNHFLGDIIGLLFLGCLVPEFKSAKKWRTFALDAFEKEMQAQVYDDGADFEGSIPYHRLVTEFFGFALLLGQEQELPFSHEYKSRLEKMFEYVWYYTKPNGLAPQIGDADDGRLFILDNFFEWERRDHRHLFTLGQELFSENNKFVQNSEATPQKTSRAFHDTGIYIFRSPNRYIAVDAGPNGQNGNGGHGHNDTLGFELAVNETDLIIDPGTYTYTPDPKARNHFRSTRMHNTVMIDGQEMNRFRDDTLFSLIEDAMPLLHRWDSNEYEDILDVLHTGYERMGVQHRRIFYFDKKKERLEITDGFVTNKPGSEHTLEWNFHFDIDVEVENNRDRIILRKESAQLIITLPETLAEHTKIREDYVSPSYGVRHKAKVLTIEYRTALPCKDFKLRFE